MHNKQLNKNIMKSFCPISYNQVNENTVRINSVIAFTLAFISIFDLAFYGLIISTFLTLDFFIRGFGDARYSIINIFGKSITSLLKLSFKKINAGPKIFAAQVGGFMSLAIFLGIALEYHIVSYIFGITLITCAFLETTIGFCVACKIHPLIRRIQMTSMDSSKL